MDRLPLKSFHEKAEIVKRCMSPRCGNGKWVNEGKFVKLYAENPVLCFSRAMTETGCGIEVQKKSLGHRPATGEGI
jgi:hypothetical protein